MLLHQGAIVVAEGTLREDGGEKFLVDVLDASQLQLQIAIVTRFITCFDMKIDEIVRAQSLDGCFCFAFEICIPKTCCSRHIDNIQTCITTNATNQVNCSDDCTLLDLRKGFCEGRHLWSIATAPRPDAIRWV